MGSARPSRRRRTLALSAAVLLLVAACGGEGSSDTGDPATTSQNGTAAASTDVAAPSATTVDTSDGAGPRPVAATIVPIEVDAFPRPAAEACADNTTVIEVSAGQSIADAAAAARPGTTISVEPGTYIERPDEWLALELATDDVCLRSDGGKVILEAAADQGLGMSITGDEIVIEGITLRGFEVGIGIDGRSGETQRSVTIEASTIEELDGEFREGIIVFADEGGSGMAVLDGLLILDVEIAGTDLGLSCNTGPCEHIWVERTTIIGRSGSGDSGADALAVEEGRQIVVVESVIEGASADGIDTKADDVVVAACQLFDLGRNGVKLWRGGDVINTIIDGTGADASLVGEEPGTYRYLHTLVAHHGDPGTQPYFGTWSYDTRSSEITVEIVNSIFYENSSGGLFVPDGATVSIRNSLFDGSAEAKLLEVGEGAVYTFGDLRALEQAGYGEGNEVVDPAFVDPLAQDYATEAASPARDAGEEIPGLDVDAAGDPRVRNGAPDIGPIES